ncbi:hypothetical protein TNIN_16121 [Trichonephila inaurata madagascariensis]|uniref:Uncharacterized protein n=1 Tax=Trichonephila inaurata madagascariensis TaxID=2747483 RepID=A0A8X6IK71_9ARAC|nr:hypothetical protein TNIN_16121 [Trichonephila inaurata madagascariensis]
MARVTGFPIHKKKGTCKNSTLQLWSRLLLEEGTAADNLVKKLRLDSLTAWNGSLETPDSAPKRALPCRKEECSNGH